MERRCSDAFAAVQHFEKTHCLALQHMALPYLQRRPQLVATCLNQAAQLGLKDEVSHDAVLLMDRTMSTGLEVRFATTQNCAALWIMHVCHTEGLKGRLRQDHGVCYGFLCCCLHLCTLHVA